MRNIHIERLKIIEKNKDNPITSFKKQIKMDEFIIIIHNNNVVFFDKNIDLLMFQEDISLKRYIIFQDVIQSNTKPHGYKKSNSIILINDKNILGPELCDEIVNIIDKRIGENKCRKEKWGTSQNVNCLFFKSDVEISKDNEILDNKVFKLIGTLIKKLFIEHDSRSRSDCGYCFRKIYGPTRIHFDGITTEAKNGILPVDKIRNMSIIIALNDDYEGGEMYFPKQDYKVKLKKGDIICFPPYETHPHMVDAPLNRTYRYTINTWLYE